MLQENPDLLKQLGNGGSGGNGKHGELLASDDKIRLALLNATCNASKKQMLLSQNHQQPGKNQSAESSPPPPLVPKRSTSYDIFKSKQDPKLSPPTPFADDSFGLPMPHIMSKTLPRRLPASSSGTTGGDHPSVRGRKSLTTEVAIPPPPQYKGVHFAPQVIERRRSSGSEATDGIPVEGLPTRPAGSNNSSLANSSGLHGLHGGHPMAAASTPKAETVAIQVRNNPVPLLSAVMKSSSGGLSGGNGNISSFEHKKQPPQPPPKTSTLTSKVMGVRDKALAASAAGCEIVFVSPDEGFNEEVLTSNSASASAGSSSEVTK